MVKRLFFAICTIGVGLGVVFSIMPRQEVAFQQSDTPIRMAHIGGFLSATVYEALDNHIDFDLQIYKLNNSFDVAFSLLSGHLDAGFLYAPTIVNFATIEGFEELTVVGKITYPTGATLVLREGLSNRITELQGLRLAATGPNCPLLHTFIYDVNRLNVDLSKVYIYFMDNDAMVAALSSASVDGALLQGVYTLVALQDGHNILYQNWDVDPTFYCCPLTINQAAKVLFARRDRLDDLTSLIEVLTYVGQNVAPSQLRQAVVNNTIIPLNAMIGQPMPSFELADDQLIVTALAHAQLMQEQGLALAAIY